jgi:hypothetical protein
VIPTVQNVWDLARAHLGDTAVAGGQYSNTLLLQFWPTTWNSLYRYLDRNNNKRLRRTKFYNIPANTGYLMPADIGIKDMGKPESMWDRTIQSTFTATVLTVNAATASVPSFADLTIPAHGLQAGAEVVSFGFGRTVSTVSDDINAEWYINVPDANTIRLNGCAAIDLGSAVGSTGIISTGSETFKRTPIQQLYDIETFPLTSAGQCITNWKWDNGIIRVTPSTTARQIRIVYMLSGNPPTTTTLSIGLDDAGDALSLFLAASLAAAKGFATKSASLFMRAVGNPSGDTTNVEGGAFYELAQLGAQEINRTRVVIPRYRPRRNVGPIGQRW